MPDMDLGTITLLQAIVSEPEHKARMAALLEQMRQLEATRAAIGADREAAERAAYEASEQLRVARETVANHAQAVRDLAEKEGKLSTVVDGINAEKARWSEQRAAIDAAQADTKKALAAQKRDQDKALGEIRAREEMVTGREEAVAAREAKVESHVGKLADAMAGLTV